MAAETSFNVKCQIHFWVWAFHMAFQGVDRNSFDGSRCAFECEMPDALLGVNYFDTL